MQASGRYIMQLIQKARYAYIRYSYLTRLRGHMPLRYYQHNRYQQHEKGHLGTFQFSCDHRAVYST